MKVLSLFILFGISVALVSVSIVLADPSGDPPTGSGVIKVDGSAPKPSLEIDASGQIMLKATSPNDRITLGKWEATAIGLSFGGTGAVDAANARLNLGAAGRGDNSDITSLSAITTLTASGTITFSGLTANRLATVGTGGALGTSITSANVAATVSDETGSGLLTFATSPTLTTPRVAILYGGTAATSSLTLRSTTATGTSDAIIFGVGTNGGTEAMRIINSGNVGIGTTSPGASEKLKVLLTSGLGTSIGSQSNDGSVALYVTPATTSQRGFIARGLSGQSAAIFSVQNSTPSDLLTVLANGNVGIGTTSPGTLLTLRKSAAGTVLAIRNTGDTADTLTIDDTGTITTGSVPWARLINIPADCGANQFVTAIDTGTCASAAGGYSTIQEEGTGLTQRATFNFVGSSITAADDGVNTRTNVTLSQSPSGSTSVVGTGRSVSAGTGLTGGGDLSVDRTISLSTPVSLTNGGTNASLTASNGGIVYSTAAAFALSGVGASGQILRSAGAATPTWSTATYPATAGTSGKILISDGTNIVSSTPTYPNAASTAGKVLRSDGTNFLTSTATYPNTVGVNQLLWASAADAVGGLATANSAVLRTTSGGVPGWSASMTNGQLLIGSSAATPVLATLTAGDGISITNAAGSITIKTADNGYARVATNMNADQSIADGVFTEMDFTVESFDTGNNFDLTTNEFTAPSTGYYSVSASMFSNTVKADTVTMIRIFKKVGAGATCTDTVVISNSFKGDPDRNSPNVVGIVQLNANDTMVVCAFFDTTDGTSVTLSASNTSWQSRNYFHVFKLQ